MYSCSVYRSCTQVGVIYVTFAWFVNVNKCMCDLCVLVPDWFGVTWYALTHFIPIYMWQLWIEFRYCWRWCSHASSGFFWLKTPLTATNWHVHEIVINYTYFWIIAGNYHSHIILELWLRSCFWFWCSNSSWVCTFFFSLLEQYRSSWLRGMAWLRCECIGWIETVDIYSRIGYTMERTLLDLVRVTHNGFRTYD